MLIKEMDSKQEEINELSLMLKDDVTPKQRFLIERELKSVKRGIYGERDSAYYIDFYFASSRNWAVIHDLRVEYKDRVAQIDHLLINRVFDIYVFESKSYYYGIRITPEGEFQAYYNRRYIGIPSPIEQNRRHVHLLEQLLKERAVLPKRMGVRIKSKFISMILVSPNSVIKRPGKNRFDTSMVIKADALKTEINKGVEQDASSLGSMIAFAKLSSSSVLEEAARRLVSYHKPFRINFRAKFGMLETGPAAQKGAKVTRNSKLKVSVPSKYYCADCKKALSEKVVKFCQENKTRFKNRVYCYSCQKKYKYHRQR